MKKISRAKGIAVTLVLIAMTGCEDGKQTHSEAVYERQEPIPGMLADQMEDTSMTPEERMHMLATQLEEITTETVHNTLTGKSAPHMPHQSGFLITGDFLWWKADEVGLEYAIEYKLSDPGAGGKFTKERVRVGSTEGSWDPGFRVGLGGMFGHHDQWDLYLNWTLFNQHASHRMSINDPSTQVLTALWMPQLLTGDYLTSAHNQWHLNYSTLDFELGRDYFISADITMRPHLGLRGAMINQNITAKYVGPLTVENVIFNDLEGSFKGRNHYFAGGMRAGTDFIWHFGSCVGLFGEISASLLYGRFQLRETVNTFQSNGDVGIDPWQFKEKRSIWATRSNIQGAIGLTFESIFDLGKYKFSLNLAYEFLEWFEQNMLNNLFFGTNQNTARGSNTLLQQQNGDLGLQGFTGNIQLDF